MNTQLMSQAWALALRCQMMTGKLKNGARIAEFASGTGLDEERRQVLMRQAVMTQSDLIYTVWSPAWPYQPIDHVLCRYTHGRVEIVEGLAPWIEQEGAGRLIFVSTRSCRAYAPNRSGRLVRVPCPKGDLSKGFLLGQEQIGRLAEIFDDELKRREAASMNS